jgi:hypothetical protein
LGDQISGINRTATPQDEPVAATQPDIMQIIADGAKRGAATSTAGAKPQSGAERRVAPRLATTANDRVTFNNVDYPLRNWSATGLLFGPMGHSPAIGQKLALKVVVRCGEDRLRFDATGEVVRVANNLIAVRYECHSGDTAARIKDHFASAAPTPP